MEKGWTLPGLGLYPLKHSLMHLQRSVTSSPSSKHTPDIVGRAECSCHGQEKAVAPYRVECFLMKCRDPQDEEHRPAINPSWLKIPPQPPEGGQVQAQLRWSPSLHPYPPQSPSPLLLWVQKNSPMHLRHPPWIPRAAGFLSDHIPRSVRQDK